MLPKGAAAFSFVDMCGRANGSPAHMAPWTSALDIVGTFSSMQAFRAISWVNTVVYTLGEPPEA